MGGVGWVEVWVKKKKKTNIYLLLTNHQQMKYLKQLFLIDCNEIIY